MACANGSPSTGTRFNAAPEGRELGLGQYQAFPGALGLQCFEPLVHGLEVMTLPHATHAGRRDREPALPQLVGDADLAESRLLDGNRHDGVFDLLCDAVFSTVLR